MGRDKICRKAASLDTKVRCLIGSKRKEIVRCFEICISTLLTLLYSEQPNLHGVKVVLSALGFHSVLAVLRAKGFHESFGCSEFNRVPLRFGSSEFNRIQ